MVFRLMQEVRFTGNSPEKVRVAAQVEDTEVAKTAEGCRDGLTERIEAKV
jgi:hypothetical protein